MSPRLGVSFALGPRELELRYPDGRRFLSYEELFALSEEAQASAAEGREQARRERQRAERQRAERLAQRLRDLGLDPEADPGT